MEKIIIDTDIGIDDAFAIRYGMLTQKILGITTVNGNVTADMATKNAKLFCKHYGLEAPVSKGASRGLVIEPSDPITDVHGSDGMGGCYENPFDADTKQNAVQFLIETFKAHPHEVTIVAIGPLTNLALAFNLCPEIIPLIKKLVIMGGAFGFNGHTGNMSNFAEFNIWKDPEAADQVMRANLETVIVPLDVTYEVLITGEEIAALHDKFLGDIAKVYLDFSLKDEGFYGMAMHDALTIEYLCHEESFKVIEKPVRVSLAGFTYGQTLIPLSKMPIPDDNFKDLPLKKICIGVNSKKVKEHILTTLKI